MAHIVVCANNQRQLLLALITYATDSEENFPPGSGYSLYKPHRARRGVGDFFDVLVPEYVEPSDLWYCPAGVLFADTNLPPLVESVGEVKALVELLRCDVPRQLAVLETGVGVADHDRT
jgi:hypothetical protein